MKNCSRHRKVRLPKVKFHFLIRDFNPRNINIMIILIIVIMITHLAAVFCCPRLLSPRSATCSASRLKD